MNPRRWGPPAHPLAVMTEEPGGAQTSPPNKQVQICPPHTNSPGVFEREIRATSEGCMSTFPFCVLTLQIMSFHHTFHSFDLPETPLPSPCWTAGGAVALPVLPNLIGQWFHLLTWVNNPGAGGGGGGSPIPSGQLSSLRLFCELHWGGQSGRRKLCVCFLHFLKSWCPSAPLFFFFLVVKYT